MITVLTPTRGRPGKLTRCISSADETADKEWPFEFLCYVDLDDPFMSAYQELSLPHTKIIYDKPKSVSVSWNDLAAESRGNILMMGNDDIVFETDGWNRIIEEETAKFPDEIYCMWVNDGINGGEHCAFPIVSRKWYEALGYFTPGIFKFEYNDTWIFDIGKRIGRCHYLEGVSIRHLHFGTYPEEVDDTYLRHRSNVGHPTGDKAPFMGAANIREADANNLRRLMR